MGLCALETLRHFVGFVDVSSFPAKADFLKYDTENDTQ